MTFYKTNSKSIKFLHIFALLALTITLGGCVDRDEADAKLVQACQKGVVYLLDEYSLIKSIKATHFSSVANKEDGDRRVTMDVVIDENYLDVEKSFSCNFIENKGFLGMSYSANISQIDMGDGQIYGRKDGEIYGGMNKWLNITKEAEAAL